MPASLSDMPIVEKYVRHGRQSALLSVVEDRSNRLLLDRLKKLIADELLLSEASRRSYRHQLGFLKLVLSSDNEGGCLRLHYWDNFSESQEDVHSHCAAFQSRVVIGALSENSFELTEGNSYACFRYRFDSKSACSMAFENGLTSVRSSATRTLTAGDIYEKCAGELHNVSDVVQGTVTVSAWGPRVEDALVLKPFGARADDCGATVGMDGIRLTAILREIIERLGRI